MHSTAVIHRKQQRNQSHSDEDRLIKQVGWRLEEVQEKGLLETEN